MAKTVPKKKTLGLRLNRYTSLPIALDVLSEKRITLLSPDAWEDRNDAYYLERYREEMKFRSVLAICFSTRSETFHQWRVFSSGLSGVGIEFDKSGLFPSIADQKGFRSGKMSYKPVLWLLNNRPEIEKWPFLKRKPFEDEAEFRIIYETKTDHLRSKNVDIDLSAIRRVTLSPWVPESVAESVMSIIKNIDGCRRLTVNRSSLIDNAGWRRAID